MIASLKSDENNLWFLVFICSIANWGINTKLVKWRDHNVSSTRAPSPVEDSSGQLRTVAAKLGLNSPAYISGLAWLI
jgi:hypothetical protein